MANTGGSSAPAPRLACWLQPRLIHPRVLATQHKDARSRAHEKWAHTLPPSGQVAHNSPTALHRCLAGVDTAFTVSGPSMCPSAPPECLMLLAACHRPPHHPGDGYVGLVELPVLKSPACRLYPSTLPSRDMGQTSATEPLEATQSCQLLHRVLVAPQTWTGWDHWLILRENVALGGICNFRSTGRGDGLMSPDLGEAFPGAQRSLGPRMTTVGAPGPLHICAAVPHGRATSEDPATVLEPKAQAHGEHAKESRGLLALMSDTPYRPGLQEVTASPGHRSRKTQACGALSPVPLKVIQATPLLPRGPRPMQWPNGIHMLVSGHMLSLSSVSSARFTPHTELSVWEEFPRNF